MSKKRKNKKFLKKLLAQKMQQQNQTAQPQTYQPPVQQNQAVQTKSQPAAIAETKEIQTPAQITKEQVVESHDKLIRKIILGDMRRILMIVILIAALFTGVYIANQKTAVFTTFSQKLFNLFDKS